MPCILLTGATGYIASHTWLALQDAGFEVVGVDNFANSSPRVLQRLESLGGRKPVFVQADVCDKAAMEQVFDAHRIEVARQPERQAGDHQHRQAVTPAERKGQIHWRLTNQAAAYPPPKSARLGMPYSKPATIATSQPKASAAAQTRSARRASS